MEPNALHPGEGERITGEGELGVTLLVDVEQIGIVDVRSEPGAVTPPLHLHARHAECFFVLEGELTVRLEDRELRASAGTWVHVPPEVVHTFGVTGGSPAHFLDIHVPGSRFGDFVRGLHVARNEDELREVRAAFDQQPAPEYATGDPGLVILRRVGGTSGVGSTEPPKSGGAGFAGAGADSGVGSTEPPNSGGAGFAGAGAEQGETMAGRSESRRATLLLDTDELTVTEFFYGPGERGATPHVHHHHADGFLVLEGELIIPFRSGPLRASAGTLVVIPPEVVHSFDNDGTENALFYNLHMPASGFGDYMRGRNPDFDQHEPPADGGADPSAVVAVRLSG